MLNVSGTAIGQEKMDAPCKPDPEAMLQGARKRIEKIKQDIENFEQMGDYYYPGAEEASLMMYGAMHKALRDVEQTEQYWLDEIDK